MINKKYRLLVVDVDGTLLDREGAISARDGEALAQARRLGIHVSLSTGRVIKACLAIINQLSLDGCHIFFNGALVSDLSRDSEVYARPLKKAVVRQLVDFAHENDIYLELYTAGGYFIERETWSADIHRRFFGLEPMVVDFGQLGPRERLLKGELVVRSPEEKAKARRLQQRFRKSLDFSVARTPAYPDVEFINIVDPGVSKGKALRALASHLGVGMSEVMAIGDGTNDIPLFKAAGLAVAMGNAHDEVKKVADYVTLDIDHSGLAAAVERFLV